MPTSLRLPARFVPVVLACIAVAATTFVRYLLAPYLGPKAPLLLFTLPVLLCALFGGVASALIATALSALSSVYFFTAEPGTLYVEDPADHLQLALFAVVALATTALGAKLDRSRAASRDSKERFRLLVQGAQDVAVFFISPRGIIESWNDGARRIKGYDSNEALGQQVSIFYTEEDRRSAVSARFLDEAAEHGAARMEAWRVRKNGERFWADVVLEVAESMVMREIERTTESLVELKRQGLRISLDDFGTGYSSLSHLSVLPIDKLKVNQTFVRKLLTDNRSLASSARAARIWRHSTMKTNDGYSSRH